MIIDILGNLVIMFLHVDCLDIPRKISTIVDRYASCQDMML